MSEPAGRLPTRAFGVLFGACMLLGLVGCGDGKDHRITPRRAGTTTTTGSVPDAGTSATTALDGSAPLSPSTTSSTWPSSTTAAGSGAAATTTSVAAAAPTTVPTTTTTTVPNRPPVVGATARDQVGPLRTTSCAAVPHTTTISVTVTDDREVAAVVLRWAQAGGGVGQRPMAQDGTTWRAPLGPFAQAGTVTYWVTAVDADVAAANSPSATIGVTPCP